MLGAVMSYGAIVAPLQAVWLETQARAPQRLFNRFGSRVAALKNVDLPRGVEVDAGIAERFDLAVVAEGGVFADCREERSRRRRAAAGAAPRLRPDGVGRHRFASRAAIRPAPAASPTSASRATARPRCCR